MKQQIDFNTMIGFLRENFFHIPTIAYFLVALVIFFSGCFLYGFQFRKLITPSKFAPSIMTASGLLGTFIGLSFGLKDLNLQNQTSMQDLINGLKLVFVYSLFGVGFSIFFMLLNLILSSRQNKINKKISEEEKKISKNHNSKILGLQEDQYSSLMKLIQLQENSLKQQELMQKDIEKLNFDNDNEQLAYAISTAIITGLKPVLTEIKEAVADQGSEAIKKVLEDLKEEILIPMKGALDNTNDALTVTNQAVKDTISAIEESQKHNDRLIAEVGSASEKMKSASESMNELVSNVDKTVNHMDEIQSKQHNSLEKFNEDLQNNLEKIQPAIQEGLSTAGVALSGAIATATLSMKKGIEESLKSAGDKLNETVEMSFKQFSEAQNRFEGILNTFSHNMDGHLNRMATELTEIGEKAESMINSASDNLKNTLGDIDKKLLNTSAELEKSLETFRIQYQESLTEYLNQQTENLNGFLDRQNDQLEQTIGKQREGLINATNGLTDQFKFMNEKQKEVNKTLDLMINQIDGIQQSILPKVYEIALELSTGEYKFSQAIDTSTTSLGMVSTALADMGRDLPIEFEKSFELLNEKYVNAFKDLDHGLAGAINDLGSVIGTIDTTVKGLIQAVPIYDILRRN